MTPTITFDGQPIHGSWSMRMTLSDGATALVDQALEVGTTHVLEIDFDGPPSRWQRLLALLRIRRRSAPLRQWFMVTGVDERGSVLSDLATYTLRNAVVQ